MKFLFEVASKVETLKLDGSKMHVFQGRMAFVNDAGEGHELGAIGFSVDEVFWHSTQPGDVIAFCHNEDADVPASLNVILPQPDGTTIVNMN